MRPVEEIQQVNDRLIYWEGYDPAVKVDLSSHAILTRDGWVLIDPIPLGDEPLAGLGARAGFAAILLTSGNHERAAADFKRKCGVPVIAHREAVDELSMETDQIVSDGDEVIGLRVIHLPGFAQGEMALYSPDHGGLMMLGDSLLNLQPGGLMVLPDKYCADPRGGRKSLQKLLQFPFEVMTFAHGMPITAGAKQQLEKIIL